LRIAARNRWPIADEFRERAVIRLMQIIDTQEDDDKVNAAIKTLATLDSLNVASEKPAPVRQSLTVNLGNGKSLTAEQRRIVAQAAKIMQQPAADPPG
jgi:hypothetical protein